MILKKKVYKAVKTGQGKLWMETLLLKVCIGMLEWKVNAFMVDDAATKIGTIRYI